MQNCVAKSAYFGSTVFLVRSAMSGCVSNATHGLVCNGFGTCKNNACTCDHYWIEPQCTSSWLLETTLVTVSTWCAILPFVYHRGLRRFFFSLYLGLLLIAIYRTTVIGRMKHAAAIARKATKRCAWLDAQLTPLLFLIVAFLMRTIYFVDPWCVCGCTRVSSSIPTGSCAAIFRSLHRTVFRT